MAFANYLLLLLFSTGALALKGFDPPDDAAVPGAGRRIKAPIATPVAPPLRAAGNVAPLAAKVSQRLNNLDHPVCGSAAIRGLLRGAAAHFQVQTVPWNDVLSLASNFIQDQRDSVSSLSIELDQLNSAIQQALLVEAKGKLTEDQMLDMLSTAVAAEGGFGSMAVAQSTACGLKARRKQHTTSYDASVAGFGDIALKTLSPGQAWIDVNQLLAICRRELAGGMVGDDDTFCNQMCMEFADIADDLSAKYAGSWRSGGTNSSVLRSRASAKQRQIDFATSEIADCNQAVTDLKQFKDQLDAMNDQAKGQFKQVTAAQNALQNAQADLDGLQNSMNEQVASVQRLATAFNGSSAVVQNIRDQLGLLEGNMTALSATIATGQQQLAAAQDKVSKAQAVSQVAKDLKAMLEKLVRQMKLYFDAAVRNPIRQLGITDSLDIPSRFPADPSATQEGNSTHLAVQDLKQACSQPNTRVAFSAVESSKLPVSHLCLNLKVAEVNKEIDQTVSAVVVAVENSLQQVKSLLNVYSGESKMSEEVEEQLIKQGEPIGLRQVAVFANTQFYQNYLRRWKLSEEFQRLYSQLGLLLVDAQDLEKQAQGSLDHLQLQMTALALQRNQTLATLSQAITGNELDKASKVAAENALAKLQQDVIDSQEQMNQLQQAAGEAYRSWQNAQQSLEATYKQGTAMVQLLQLLEAAPKSRSVSIRAH